MIKNIKLGIKIATRNFDFIPDIYSNKNIIDFIEIILMPEFTLEDIEIIENLEMPYALHLPNLFNKIDFGDISTNDKNLEYIKKVNLFHNQLAPICVIIHPETGDIDLSIENIKKLMIKPLAIENMPLKSLVKASLLGYDIASLKRYFEEIPDLEFCLDLNHAIKAALSKKLDYMSFIKEFLNFKDPILFHISGGGIEKEVDEHLSLDNAEYNLLEIKKLLFDFKKPVNLTFETPRDYEKGIEDDLKNMEFFIEC
jgi:hypothetical protein